MNTKTINISNKTIRYKVAGHGKPVILLHGFGEDGTVWEKQIDFLQNRYRLIVPDIPGSGASELTDDVSMEGIAEAVKQIAEKEEAENFVLIGHSMGGYATLAFAEKYADLLKGFGLFHSSAYADTEEKKNTRRKGIDFIKEHGGKAFFKTATPNLFSENTKEENPALIKTFMEALPEFSNAALIAYYEAMIARPDRTKILQTTLLPVLFIIGKHDKAALLEDSLKQSSMPETSFVTLLNRSGHMGMLEETNQSNNTLEKFLGEVMSL